MTASGVARGLLDRPALWAALLTYGVLSILLFGGPLKPLAYPVPTMAVAARVWLAPAVAGLLLGLLAARRLRRTGRAGAVSAFVAAAMVGAVGGAGLLATQERARAIAALAPDLVETRSFLASLHFAPAELQFSLHAAALRECRAYAWSYTTLSFYELAPRTAVNVLPPDWVEACGFAAGVWPE